MIHILMHMREMWILTSLLLQLEVENQPEYRYGERHVLINDQWIQGNQLEE